MKQIRPVVYVRGIKKRCRKVATHTINLPVFESHDIGSINEKELKLNALVALKQVMRQSDEAHIVLRHQEVKDNTLTFLLYDQRNKQIPLELED